MYMTNIKLSSAFPILKFVFASTVAEKPDEALLS